MPFARRDSGGSREIVPPGARDGIERARAIPDEHRIRLAPPKMPAAFRSRFTAPARDEPGAFRKGFRVSPPRATVIAGLTARPYAERDIAVTPGERISGSVRWPGSIRCLSERTSADDCRQVGEAKVLTRVAEQLRTASTTPARVAARTRPRLFRAAFAGGDERARAGLTEQLPDVPVTAMTGEDERFTPAGADARQRETARPPTTRRFPGDHFFVRAPWPAPARAVRSGPAVA